MENQYHNNIMKSCKLYKEGSTWYFDDEYLGIHKEAFVSGSSELFDYILYNVTKATNIETPTLIGSPNPFPGYEAVIEKLRGPKELEPFFKYEEFISDEDWEMNGVWYRYKNLEGNYQYNWFCSVFKIFFNPIPDKIYLKFVN